MTLWYLNNSDEPVQDESNNPALEDIDRVELGQRILSEGIWTLDKCGKSIWIPPHRILKVVL